MSKTQGIEHKNEILGYFPLFFVSLVNLVSSSYFCCVLYLVGGSCSQTTFEKIEKFICQSQEQNLAFKLDNF